MRKGHSYMVFNSTDNFFLAHFVITGQLQFQHQVSCIPAAKWTSWEPERNVNIAVSSHSKSCLAEESGSSRGLTKHLDLDFQHKSFWMTIKHNEAWSLSRVMATKNKTDHKGLWNQRKVDESGDNSGLLTVFVILVQVVQRHVASFQSCCAVPPPPLFAAATALAAPQAPKSETHRFMESISRNSRWNFMDDKNRWR